mmetsp:Transcript_11308/g.26887  ORF Transcript_11308/g.26887 Transcript_11308/m.26887 type:complete len:386 (-) Transcript_11308:1215-2372(-)
MLDPMSRSHFERTLPNTKDTLSQMNFTSFSKYTAVGPNSGPNQAALYTGRTLTSREGIAAENEDEEINNIGRKQQRKRTWIGDTFHDEGKYVTLKSEDGCIKNSNMVQSIHPNTTHGKALEGMFCFEHAFDRPNCIGSDFTSQLLLQYGQQFMDTYEEQQQQPWAAFLHLIDSHEDTMMLASITVDDVLSNFLKSQPQSVLNDTVVVVLSDHGLHYGLVFSTELGRREATEPMFHIRIPESLLQNHPEYLQALIQNSQLYTTPFDVHTTLLELAGISIETQEQEEEPFGRSLLSPLPDDRMNCNTVLPSSVIPKKYCDLQKVSSSSSVHGHDVDDDELVPTVPNLWSFFHDIPLHRRPIMELDNLCPSETNDSGRRRLPYHTCVH